MPYESAASPHYPILNALVDGLKAKNVFEFGCGGSTEVLAAAAEKRGCRVYTVDPRPLNKTNSKAEQIQYARWTFFNMKSAEALKKVSGVEFDLVFHDGAHDHATVKQDLETILPQIRNQGMLLVHDVDLEEVRTAVEEALVPYKHAKVTLPYACGLAVITLEGRI
jgi:predicted O-methyltransferase YrrM